MHDFVHAQCLDIVPLHTVENKQIVAYVVSVRISAIGSQWKGEKHWVSARFERSDALQKPWFFFVNVWILTHTTNTKKKCSIVSSNTLLTIPEHEKIQIYLILLRCEYITMSLCKFTSYKSLASLEKRNTRVLHDQAKARKLKTLKNALHPVQDFLDFSIMFTSLHIVK